MRLDRHERLAKALKKLRCCQDNFRKEELNKSPCYYLGIRAIVSENLSTSPMLCYDLREARKYRAVAIHVHYLALCGLIENAYMELEKGFIIENMWGCPEITLLKSQKKPPSCSLNRSLVVPFWISINDSIERIKKFIDMSWILSFNE